MDTYSVKCHSVVQGHHCSPLLTASNPMLWSTASLTEGPPPGPVLVFVRTFCAMMRVLRRLAAAAADRPPLVGGGAWGGVCGCVVLMGGGEGFGGGGGGGGGAVVVASEARVWTRELRRGPARVFPCGWCAVIGEADCTEGGRRAGVEVAESEGGR